MSTFSLAPDQVPPEEGLECSICLQTLLDPVMVLPCGTMFCRKCWNQTAKEECPHCRGKLPVVVDVPRYVKDKLSSLLVHCDLCAVQMKQEECKRHDCPEQYVECKNSTLAFKFSVYGRNIQTPAMKCHWEGKKSRLSSHNCSVTRLEQAQLQCAKLLANAGMIHYIDPEQIDGINWVQAEIIQDLNCDTSEMSYRDPISGEAKVEIIDQRDGNYGMYYELSDRHAKVKAKHAVRINRKRKREDEE